MQKETFLSGEGDQWVNRNRNFLNKIDWEKDDPLFKDLFALGLPEGTKVLEIGCGEGSRLARLSHALKWECYGIDPSIKGVQLANEKGIQAIQGTADKIPWDGNTFDLVIFGFCLYLCDRQDLFRIASEADRVLKEKGWLSILDFFSSENRQNSYAHKDGIMSFKMDYRKLFLWHPHYECFSHKMVDHQQHQYTDNPDNWVSISILRKNSDFSRSIK